MSIKGNCLICNKQFSRAGRKFAKKYCSVACRDKYAARVLPIKDPSFCKTQDPSLVPVRALLKAAIEMLDAVLA
jgi:hypothetical protein